MEMHINVSEMMNPDNLRNFVIKIVSKSFVGRTHFLLESDANTTLSKRQHHDYIVDCLHHTN